MSDQKRKVCETVHKRPTYGGMQTSVSCEEAGCDGFEPMKESIESRALEFAKQRGWVSDSVANDLREFATRETEAALRMEREAAVREFARHVQVNYEHVKDGGVSVEDVIESVFYNMFGKELSDVK